MLTILVWAILIPKGGSCCAGAKPTPRIADSCPICGLDVPKDTDRIDNEVRLEKGAKKTLYRCVLCAIADVKSGKADVTIAAPSEAKGKPVKIVRSGGKWSVEPPDAAFVYIEGSHAQCEIRYRALTSEKAFDAYVQTSPRVLKGAKLISLAELIKKSE